MLLFYISSSYEHSLWTDWKSKRRTQIRHSTTASGPGSRGHCVLRQQVRRGLTGERQASAADILSSGSPPQASSEPQASAETLSLLGWTMGHSSCFLSYVAKPRQTCVIAVTLIQGQRPHRWWMSRYRWETRPVPLWTPRPAWVVVRLQWLQRFTAARLQQSGNWGREYKSQYKILNSFLTKAIIDACYIQESLKMTFPF